VIPSKTFADILSEKANQIYPGKSLKDLCLTKGQASSKKAIRKIMQEGGEFLSPYWLSRYFPISLTTAKKIQNE